MSRITLKQAAEWCGGRVEEKYENVTFYGANIDSRNLLPGQLFVALKGILRSKTLKSPAAHFGKR